MSTKYIKAGSAPPTAAGGAAGVNVDTTSGSLEWTVPGSAPTTVHTAVDLDTTQTITGNKTFTGTVVMSGAVTKTEFADGTVLLPSITFSDDLDSGAYRIGANNVGVAVNGAKVLDVSTTGLGVTGTTLSGDGTVSLPGIGFSGDTDNGLYRIGTNNVGFAAAGAKVFEIASGTLTTTGVVSLLGGTAGAATAALIAGGGTSGTPCATATADKNFLGFWTKTTATSGDSRGLYLRTYFSGAGVSGEAARIFGTVDNVTAAVGGTVNGAHISLSITGASGAVSGQGFAARLTLGADAQTRTLNANVAVLNLDSDIATGNTVPADLAFVRVTDTGAVRIGSLLKMPNVSNGTIFAAHTTQTLTHSIKIISDDGTAYYVMCTDAATNRS